MTLQLYSFDQFVNQQVSAMQAVAGVVLDFQIGADFLALVQSNSGLALSLQAQASYDLAVARLTTSTGNNVDTFVQQFGLTRNPATNSYGLVTFSRFTTTQEAIIAAGTFDLTTQGALVYSPSNGVTYSVYADTTNDFYEPSLNAYVIPPFENNINIPVVATIAGSIGDVLPNQINTIYSVIPNVDSVTNPSIIDTGQDQESDAALRARFVLYLNGLSKANSSSIAAAILSVSGVVRYKLVEFFDLLGNPVNGFFYAVIDDGEGNASPTLLANVQAAIYAVKALGIAFSVYAPTAFPVNILAHVYTDGTVTDSTVQSEVTAALTNYIETQSFDAILPYSRIPEIIYDADSSITNVKNYTVNGGTTDISISGTNIMIVGTLTVIINA